MKKPLIGVSGSHMVDGGGMFPGYHRSYVNDDYIRSVIDAGGIPVILPYTADDEVVRETMEHVDGLLLSGGHDLYPLTYGEEPKQGLGGIWPARDHFDFLLVEMAKKRGLPIMGICRGLQIVNVYHGGSLYQDLKYDKNCYIKHFQNQSPAMPTHTVTIEADSHFAEIVGCTSWMTNTHHHQTVNKVGKGLRVVATAKDGTVEALEATDYPYLMSYQFHPEMMSVDNEKAKLLFKDFVNHAAKMKEAS